MPVLTAMPGLSTLFGCLTNGWVCVRRKKGKVTYSHKSHALCMKMCIDMDR